MALNAKKIPGKDFKRPDPLDSGTYPVRLVQILSLGLQEQRPYKGEEKDPAHELMNTYECLDEFMKDEETGEDILDKPRWLSETFPLYSLDSDLAKSTKRYYALDPDCEQDGDWAKLAGNPGMLTVVQNKGSGKNSDRIYANITSLSSMRDKDAAKAPELVNPPKVFDIDEPDMEVFFSLPEWIQDKMKSNLEFEGSPLEKALEAHKDGEEGGSKKKGKSTTEEASKEVSDTTEDEKEDW